MIKKLMIVLCLTGCTAFDSAYEREHRELSQSIEILRLKVRKERLEQQLEKLDSHE